ncbi:hypothetical protein PUN28_020175 [Cardiocondyla obscurior]|uniref:Uncharacterized protein n=1 Tax=Cardiocondyla obscurior TaxID=286306 RepID=A0AAW2E882_9HYME
MRLGDKSNGKATRDARKALGYYNFLTSKSYTHNTNSKRDNNIQINVPLVRRALPFKCFIHIAYNFFIENPRIAPRIKVVHPRQCTRCYYRHRLSLVRVSLTE